MAATFNSNTRIDLVIDGVNVTIDGISKKVVKALEKVTIDSARLAQNSEDSTAEAILRKTQELADICKCFLQEACGQAAYQQLTEQKVDDVNYLIDVTTFVIDEIRKSKEARMERMAKLSGTVLRA